MSDDKPNLNRDAAARARAIAAEMFPEEPKPAAPKVETKASGSRKIERQIRDDVVAAAREALAKDPVWNPPKREIAPPGAAYDYNLQRYILTPDFFGFDPGAPSGDKTVKITVSADGSLSLPDDVERPLAVDDVEYPNIKSALITLRAICADRVHGRNICNAIAKALGLDIGEWDSEKWQETIRKTWFR